ncbi:DUF998 domain-containing protein [Hoyosella subflava]|uniref:Hypothetical membrane protein n=1 Tax=Hoyosella subflava (strain DSM 45089 / JCM 17490 / NBRC 109087 / DQS3-9A1) TaxID=443218 RepID=F6EH66_HOYSD|nr:DUF998 domain-containing protein [Hoyosella subflava]AEF39903.1 Hypothetical membrane protein [Hoyosella subflava DQS3-9A1]
MTSQNSRNIAAGAAWSLAFAYLAAEIVTAYAWKTTYSFQHRTISDLGVTDCTPELCSPLHPLMNATFVTLGVLTIFGAVLFSVAIPHGYRRRLIVSLAVLTGLSTAATGLVPSNYGIVPHMLAVLPGFIARHILLILVAIWMWQQHRLVAILAALCALSGLSGIILLVATPVHIGISERIVLYPLPVFMAFTGTAIMTATLVKVRSQRRALRHRDAD